MRGGLVALAAVGTIGVEGGAGAKEGGVASAGEEVCVLIVSWSGWLWCTGFF